jgi:hypothetical protein
MKADCGGEEATATLRDDHFNPAPLFTAQQLRV